VVEKIQNMSNNVKEVKSEVEINYKKRIDKRKKSKIIKLAEKYKIKSEKNLRKIIKDRKLKMVLLH
jgi:hypothetical protein